MPRATDKYRVNEIFYSIQGEGANTGQAAIFVRFSGCNLKCRFCDTDHSKYRLFSEDELINKIVKVSKQTSCKFVIFTGGEPSCQKVEPVAKKLRGDFIVALETNGTNPLHTGVFNWVTVSPKREYDWAVPIERDGEHEFVVANEFKFIVDNRFHEGILDEFFEKHEGYPVYLQPMSQDEKCTAKAIELVKRRPNQCRLSLQTQKYGNFA